MKGGSCAKLAAAGVAVLAALVAVVYETCWAPIRDPHLHFTPASDPQCLERAQAVRCPKEDDLSTLDSAGFSVLRNAVDPKLFEGIAESLGMIPQSRNQNVNGSFLENKGPEFFSEALRARLDELVDRAARTAGKVGAGKPLHLDNVAFYATGRPGWPSWRQVPHHQDHESFFLFGSANYLLVFVVVDKEDANRDNIDFVSFEALGKCNPAFRSALEGTGASISLPVAKTLAGKFRLNSWQQKIPQIYDRLLASHTDSETASAWPFGSLKTLQVWAASGRWMPMDIDMEEVNCTPSLNVGDVVMMRGDVLHQTQQMLGGQQTRRLALAAHYIDPSAHGLSTNLLKNAGPVLLRGLSKNPLYAESFGAMKAAGLKRTPMGRRKEVQAASSVGTAAYAKGFWTQLFHWRFRLMGWMVEARESMIIAGWNPSSF